MKTNFFYLLFLLSFFLQLVITRLQSGIETRYTYSLSVNDAVDDKGKSVFLPRIDFVKLQNAGIIYWKEEQEPLHKNKKIYGIRDLHLVK